MSTRILSMSENLFYTFEIFCHISIVVSVIRTLQNESSHTSRAFKLLNKL